MIGNSFVQEFPLNYKISNFHRKDYLGMRLTSGLRDGLIAPMDMGLQILQETRLSEIPRHRDVEKRKV